MEREGRTARLTAGRNGVDGSSESAVHAEGGRRIPVTSWRWFSRARRRERERGTVAEGAGTASASFCRGRGAGDAPTMAQDVGEEAVAACGLTGAAVAEGGRWRRQVGPGGQRLGAGHRRAATAGARVGRRGLLGRAKRAAGPAVVGVLGRGAGKGESWAAVPGRAGKGERGPAGRFQERGRKEEKYSFLFYFFYNFPNPFLNSNFNSF